jgi:hypothetical protein
MKKKPSKLAMLCFKLAGSPGDESAFPSVLRNKSLGRAAIRLLGIAWLSCTLVACSIFDPEEGSLIRTDKDAYVVSRSDQSMELTISFTYTNQTGRTAYLPKCLSVHPPHLEKFVNGNWVLAYASAVPACLEPPVQVKSGKTYQHIFKMTTCPNCSPFLPDKVEGTYRLVWGIYETWEPDRYRPALGKQFPLAQRVSNEFRISE